MSTELVVREDRLSGLAKEIRAEHEEVKQALQRSLAHALRVGDLLLEVRELLPSDESFGAWAERECGLTYSVTRAYARLSYYQAILPDGLKMQEAIDYIRGLPPYDGRKTAISYPKEVKRAAKEMRKNRVPLRAISSSLDVPMSTIQRWVTTRPKRASREQRAVRLRQLERVAQREGARQQAQKEARARGGAVDRAYGLLRKLAQELDAAAASTEIKEQRLELRKALTEVHGAETHLIRALGVDYSKQEYRATK